MSFVRMTDHYFQMFGCNGELQHLKASNHPTTQQLNRQSNSTWVTFYVQGLPFTIMNSEAIVTKLIWKFLTGWYPIAGNSDSSAHGGGFLDGRRELQSFCHSMKGSSNIEQMDDIFLYKITSGALKILDFDASRKYLVLWNASSCDTRFECLGCFGVS